MKYLSIHIECRLQFCPAAEQGHRQRARRRRGQAPTDGGRNRQRVGYYFIIQQGRQ
jgi:hypothetical protein